MIQNEKIYQSILSQLSLVPAEHLQRIDVFLRKLTNQVRQKEQNRQKILSLAGAWQDMSEEDFNDFLQITKQTKNDIFNREIDL